MGLGRNSVSSESRVPKPPARITTFMILSIQHLLSLREKARLCECARDCSGNTFLPLCGKKDWSGKPGFRREAPEMRPEISQSFF
jgi:hypothetical protein